MKTCKLNCFPKTYHKEIIMNIGRILFIKMKVKISITAWIPLKIFKNNLFIYYNKTPFIMEQ